jgi:uncharacterized iron-regulated protein
MKSIIYLLICTISPSVLLAQPAEQSYKIYDVKSKTVISPDELVKNIKSTDVLFFGEEHNDSIGHLLEAQLFEKVTKAYPGTALSLEMFSTDVQTVINEYLAAVISEKNFTAAARAWNNYTDYRPLVEFAKANKTAVIAANAATRYTNAVTFSGLAILEKLPAPSKSFLPPLPIDTATGRYEEKFLETLGGHSMGNMKIYQTQNLWDATMAWSIAKYTGANPHRKIFQVNGRFHSDEKIGIIAQLKKYAPKLTVTNISCFSPEDFDHPDWQKYAVLGDYIIITSAAKK